MSTVKTYLDPATRCSLLDVDLPFLKVLPQDTLDNREQYLEVAVGIEVLLVKATPVREDADKGLWVRLVGSQAAGSELERHFIEQRREALASLERRFKGRLRRRFSVKSPELPSQCGVTYDVSDTGLRLVTDAPVAVGEKLRLLYRESEKMGPRVVLGEAVWTTPTGNDRHHVGIRFLKNIHN